jgi:hypothetical protein
VYSVVGISVTILLNDNIERDANSLDQETKKIGRVFELAIKTPQMSLILRRTFGFWRRAEETLPPHWRTLRFLETGFSFSHDFHTVGIHPETEISQRMVYIFGALPPVEEFCHWRLSGERRSRSQCARLVQQTQATSVTAM